MYFIKQNIYMKKERAYEKKKKKLSQTGKIKSIRSFELAIRIEIGVLFP